MEGRVHWLRVVGGWIGEQGAATAATASFATLSWAVSDQMVSAATVVAFERLSVLSRVGLTGSSYRSPTKLVLVLAILRSSWSQQAKIVLA